MPTLAGPQEETRANTISEEDFIKLPKFLFTQGLTGRNTPALSDEHVFDNSSDHSEPGVDVSKESLGVSQTPIKYSKAPAEGENTRLVVPPKLCQAITDCSICLDEFCPGESLVCLPLCKHPFHEECLRPWLLDRQGSCPLCKTVVATDSSDKPPTSS